MQDLVGGVIIYIYIYIYIYAYIEGEKRERQRERHRDTHMHTDKASATDRTLLEGARVHGGNNNLVGLIKTR